MSKREAEAQFIELGRLEREWGIRGELRGLFYNPDSALIASLDRIYVTENGSKVPYALSSPPVPYRQEYLFQIKGVTTPELARQWRGRPFFYPVARLPALSQGEFYWFQALGADVWDNEGQRWGKLLRLEGGAAHPYLVIEAEDGREILYPADSGKLLHFDGGERKLLVESISGLRDGE